MEDRPATPVDPVKKIELMRREMQFEHQLISTRLSALLAGQPFLLAAFAVSARWEAHHHQQLVWFYSVIPVVGFLVAILALLAVLEGERRLQVLRERLYNRDRDVAELAEQMCPRLSPRQRTLSVFYAVALPAVFALAWIYVAIVGIWHVTHGGI